MCGGTLSTSPFLANIAGVEHLGSGRAQAIEVARHLLFSRLSNEAEEITLFKYFSNYSDVE
jgi:hypothetical protein